MLAIVGSGRAGGALAGAARTAGLDVRVGGRDDAAGACAEAEAVLLCVPDGEIESACLAVAAGATPAYLGHVSGATRLDALATAAERGCETFSIHPLQTIPDPETDLTGAPCAISGSSPAAIAFATELAERLGLRAFELDDDARVAYHAAACIASNFLVTLQESAAELLERTGVDNARELLAPLVLRTAANWSENGDRALTGPIARDDEETVTRHLEELAERSPELVALYEALAERTRALTARSRTASSRPAEEAIAR